MRKIALILAMLLIPCVSFAGLLGSSSSTTPVSKEYKQQLMGSPVYIQIFKEERTLDLYVKMGEQYQLLDDLAAGAQSEDVRMVMKGNT